MPKSKVYEKSKVLEKSKVNEKIQADQSEAKHDPEPEPEKEWCPICLIDYEEGEELRELPCGHLYHPQCIDSWFAKKKNCPYCKQDVNKPLATVNMTYNPENSD